MYDGQGVNGRKFFKISPVFLENERKEKKYAVHTCTIVHLDIRIHNSCRPGSYYYILVGGTSYLVKGLFQRYLGLMGLEDLILRK